MLYIEVTRAPPHAMFHPRRLILKRAVPPTLRFNLPPPPNEQASFVIEIGMPEVQGCLLRGETVRAVDIDSPFSSVPIPAYRRNHATFGVGHYCHDTQRHPPAFEQSGHQGIDEPKAKQRRGAICSNSNVVQYQHPGRWVLFPRRIFSVVH